MILFLIHIGLIGWLIYIAIKTNYDELSAFSWAGVVILCVVFLMTFAISYGSYVGLREYTDGHVLQHDLKALTAISETINSDDNLIAETKDGYYEGLTKEIVRAKERVNAYNGALISKRLYGNNIVFGWYVIEPDEDMKIINVEKYNYNLGE